MKKHMLFLIWTSLLLISSCQSKETTILDYITNRHQKSIPESTLCLLVLSDKACANCNLAFKDFVLQHRDNDKVQIILTAKGKLFDIAPFKSPRTLIDQNISATEYADLDRSQAIFIKDQKIDTTVIIDAKSINDQMLYLSDRIK